jgi:hypothetical protein
MHQGEATTSQLGWHPAEPPSYAATLRRNFIKKRVKILHEGGLGQNPKKKKQETKRNQTEK